MSGPQHTPGPRPMKQEFYYAYYFSLDSTGVWQERLRNEPVIQPVNTEAAATAEPVQPTLFGGAT